MTYQWLDVDPIEAYTDTRIERRNAFQSIIHAQDTKYVTIDAGHSRCDWCHREVRNVTGDKLPMYHHKVRAHGPRLSKAWQEMDAWIEPAESNKDGISARFVGGDGKYIVANAEFNGWLSSMYTRSASERESRDAILAWLSDDRDSMDDDRKHDYRLHSYESIGLDTSPIHTTLRCTVQIPAYIEAQDLNRVLASNGARSITKDTPVTRMAPVAPMTRQARIAFPKNESDWREYEPTVE